MAQLVNCIVVLLIAVALFVTNSNANNGILNCGNCASGEERAQGTAFTCGQCVPVTTSCRVGYFRDDAERKCVRCPCHLTDTPCSKDSRSGEVICVCPAGYFGKNCDKCSPGYKQENSYPYRCLSTSGLGINYTPPLGRTRRACPDVGYASSNCTTNNCGYNCYNGCNNNAPTNPSLPQVQCPTNPNPPQVQCPTYPNPPQVQCPSNPNPPQIQCPTNPNLPQVQCPTNPNNQVQCPSVPSPGQPICGNNCNYNCGQTCNNICPEPCPQYPCPQPCPQTPCPQPCPQPPCPQPCPQPPCPQPCPQVPCPQPCPQPPCPRPCPQPPCPQPCPQYPCPAPCPNPCSNKTCDVTCTGKCNVTCEGVPAKFSQNPCLWKCDPRGTYSIGSMGCICKANAEGPNCSKCKKGYFGPASGNPLGCAKCFCSGVTDVCTTAVYYRNSLSIDLRQIKLINRVGATVGPSNPGPGRAEYRFTGRDTDDHYWVLPLTIATGNHLTSYGGVISCYRQYSASSSGSSVPGDDIIIEGARGGAIFWTTPATTPSDSNTKFDAKIDELNGWMVGRNNASFMATRADILTILANVKRILIRASFKPNMQSTMLRDCTLASTSPTSTNYGLTRRIEDCSCPFGYAGHSCESCTPGFYRDLTDMSQSVFGSCKLCPCGQNSEGCKLVFGTVQCICKTGFSGPKCVDRDSCSVSMNPCRVRDCTNTEVSFNCTYTSTRNLKISFASIPPSQLPYTITDGRSASITLPISASIGRISCEIRDPSTNDLVLQAFSTIIPVDCEPPRPPPGVRIRVAAEPKFLCKNVSETVEFKCQAWSFSSSMLSVGWIRSANQQLPSGRAYSSGGTLRISNLRLEDTGTYYCFTTTSNSVQIDEVNLVVVKQTEGRIEDPYPVEELFHDEPDTSNSTTNSPHIQNNNNKIRITPRYLEVEVGKPVKLTCEVTNETSTGLEVYWRKEGHAIEKDVNINGTVLRIPAVKPRHSGIYHCVYPEESNKSSAKAKLKVLSPETAAESQVLENVPPTHALPVTITTTEAPFGIVIGVSPPAHLLQHGDNITLECKSKVKDLKVRWYKENGKIRHGSQPGKKEGVLILHSIVSEDSGWYVCEGETKQGDKVNGRVLITIKQKPVVPQVIISPASPLMVRVGHAVRIECQTTGGEPSPTVTWTKFVGETEQTLLEAQTANAIFEIRKATVQHSGEYFCTARNEGGLNRSSIVVIVEEPIACTVDQFQCHSLDQCISLGERCNGEHDCKDGSDERHCRHQRHAHRH